MKTNEELRWVAIYKVAGNTVHDYCRKKRSAVKIAKANGGRVVTVEEADRMYGGQR